MLVNKPAEYSAPDHNDTSREALLSKQQRNDNAFPCTPPSQEVDLFCPLRGPVCHLKWWLTKYLADHVNIFDMYAEMGIDECTEIEHNFHDSQNPSVHVTSPKVCRIHLNFTTTNHTVSTRRLSL